MMNEITTNIIVSLVTCVIAMIAFWMIEARDYVTEGKVSRMIELQSPRAIKDIEEERKVEQEKLSALIERNTRAINALEVQIAVLNHTLLEIQKSNE